MTFLDPLDADLSGQICPCCREFKPWSAFPKNRRECPPCIYARTNADRRSVPGEMAIRQAACRAAARGLPFDLYVYRPELLRRFQIGCELTGLPFNFERRGKGGKWDSPSIDRIIPEKGYVLSNIRVILYCLNAAFNNWGEDQFEIVARAWLAKKD